MDCLFCKIINKELDSKIVYEDEHTIAIMDIFPITNGHVLVIPKEHYLDVRDAPKDIQHAIQDTIQHLTNHLTAKLDAKGFHVISNIGSAQEIKHLHYHLIPVYEKSPFTTEKSADKDDLDSYFDRIKLI